MIAIPFNLIKLPINIAKYSTDFMSSDFTPANKGVNQGIAFSAANKPTALVRPLNIPMILLILNISSRFCTWLENTITPALTVLNTILARGKKLLPKVIVMS